MFWDEKMETLKPADLQALQLKRLKKTLRSVQQVEFYQKQFENAGIATSDIKILEDLQKVPFTKKQDLRDGYPFGFFAVPMRKIVRIHTTSGTTGKPTVVGYTRRDLDTWANLIARNMTMIGIGENDVFQNMVNYGMFTGGLGFHYGAEMIGMTVIPSATGNTRRQIEMIRDFGVTTIHCTPSYAMHLSEVAEEMGETLDSLKTGIFGAEPWSDTMRNTLEKRLGLTAYDSYGLSELLARVSRSNVQSAMGSTSGMTVTLSKLSIRKPGNVFPMVNGGNWL